MRVVEETLLILQENLRDFLLELDLPVSRWVFSVPDLLQGVFDSSISDWKINSPLSVGNITSFASRSFRVDFRFVQRFQLFKVCKQYITLRNSLRVQYVSEEQIQVRLSCRTDVVANRSLAEIG